MDYIQGGCDISLVLAMDFTLSNKAPSDPESFHYDQDVKGGIIQN